VGDQRPIVQKTLQETRIEQRMVHHRHHLTVEFVADLAAVEVADRRPMLTAYPQQVEPGMDAAAGGVVASMSSPRRGLGPAMGLELPAPHCLCSQSTTILGTQRPAAVVQSSVVVEQLLRPHASCCRSEPA
jgi:hypothetical protein